MFTKRDPPSMSLHFLSLQAFCGKHLFIIKFRNKLFFTLILLLCFSTSLWLQYGFILHDMTMIFVNSVGFGLQSFYLTFYYKFTLNRVHIHLLCLSQCFIEYNFISFCWPYFYVSFNDLILFMNDFIIFLIESLFAFNFMNFFILIIIMKELISYNYFTWVWVCFYLIKYRLHEMRF